MDWSRAARGTRALPQKQKFHTGGKVLEYITSGFGRPVIVLLSGAGVFLESWCMVYPEVERLGTVFAYNRPGTGGSGRANKPLTGEVVIATLRELLASIGLQAPYVLVGHSLGGLYANLYARLFPNEIAAVVLLDATHPKDKELLDKYQGRVARAINGVLTVLDTIFRNGRNEEIRRISETIGQIAVAGSFPDVPLVVVTGGKRPPSWLISPAAFQIRQKNQKSLSALSRQGKQIIADRSGHVPQLTQPDLVIDAIREAAQWALTN